MRQRIVVSEAKVSELEAVVIGMGLTGVYGQQADRHFSLPKLDAEETLFHCNLVSLRTAFSAARNPNILNFP